MTSSWLRDVIDSHQSLALDSAEDRERLIDALDLAAPAEPPQLLWGSVPSLRLLARRAADALVRELRGDHVRERAGQVPRVH